LAPLIVRLGFLLAAVAAVGCRDHAPTSRVKDDPFLSAPAHTSYGLDILLTDSVWTKARVHAAVGRIWDERQETTLGGGVDVAFFDRQTGRIAATLTADSAVVDDRTKNMTAIGNVVVRSDSTRTQLVTDRLMWIHATQRIRANDPVRITTPSETIDGVGFESDQLLTDYRIFKVKGVHRP